MGIIHILFQGSNIKLKYIRVYSLVAIIYGGENNMYDFIRYLIYVFLKTIIKKILPSAKTFAIMVVVVLVLIKLFIVLWEHFA